MAYQAKREQKVVEDFELVNEHGEIVESFQVELNAGSMVEKLNSKYMDLLRAQQDAQKLSGKSGEAGDIREAYIKLGAAVVDIIEAIFGKEDTKRIIEFYEENYAEMVKEVIPFVTTVVIPRVRSVAQQNKQEILSKYNRKSRRTMARRS